MFTVQEKCCIVLIFLISSASAMFFFISSAVQMQYLACWYKQHFTQCAGPENIHTPPTEGTGISWGVGGSVRPKNLKKCMKLCWNFQRGLGGGGGAKKKSLLWVRYAYFIELHNT